MGIIYLDNAATTKCHEQVLEKISDINRNFYANPEATYCFAAESQKQLEAARGDIADIMLADKDEIYFTCGATEANNMAVLGVYDARKRAGDHIITTKIEHASVENAIKKCEALGARVSYVKTRRGELDYDDLESKICDRTVLLSFMLVNNELGNITDIKKIRDILKNKSSNAYLHCDAVQGFGKIECDTKAVPADIITFSSHKIHGPKGAGAIYIKKGVKVNAVIYGGGQESGLRPGTHNLPAIVGFSTACKISFENFKKRTDKMHGLKKYLIEKLSAYKDLFKINSNEFSASHIINVSTPVKSEVMLRYLEGYDIFVSAGSACSAKGKTKNILAKAGFEKERVAGALRISFGDFNEKEEIDILVDKMVSGANELFGFGI